MIYWKDEYANSVNKQYFNQPTLRMNLTLSPQSLLMVFAHLILSQLEAVLDFLTSVPGPTGKPALEFILTEWCSRQHLFYGSYERKIRQEILHSISLIILT